MRKPVLWRNRNRMSSSDFARNVHVRRLIRSLMSTYSEHFVRSLCSFNHRYYHKSVEMLTLDDTVWSCIRQFFLDDVTYCYCSRNIDLVAVQSESSVVLCNISCQSPASQYKAIDTTSREHGKRQTWRTVTRITSILNGRTFGW